MTSKNSKKQAFKKCQNRFRGLISTYRSSKFEMNRRLPKSLVLRSGLKELYLEAQAMLHPSQYDAFLNWVDGQIRTSLKDFHLSPIGYEELSGVASTVPLTPIENQLLWLAVRFNRNRIDLNKYIEIKRTLEQQALHGDYSLALQNLDVIDSIFGKSLWSIQIRIALTQQYKGLEEQKKLTSELRKVFRHGLLNFVAFYTSVRNEEKTTFQKYVSEVGQRLTNHKYYSTAIKDFLKLFLTRQWPDELDRKLGIIQVSESHSLIDTFETFIQFSENLVEEGITAPREHVDYRHILAKPLVAINSINDHRIQKLKTTIGEAKEDCALDVRNDSIIESLLAGKATDAYLELSDQLKGKAHFDAWHLIYACYALFLKERVPDRLSRGVAGATITAVSRVLCGQDRVEWAGISQKLCANFCFLPSIHGVEKYLDAILGKTASTHASLTTICVNSSFSGPEDILITTDIGEKGIPPRLDSQKYLSRLWHSLAFGEMAELGLPSVQDVFCLGLWNLETGNAENSIKLLRKAQDLDEFGIFDLSIFDGLITAYTELGDYESVISLTSRFVAKHPEIYSVLPKLRIIGDLTWADFKRIDPSSIDRAIGLHVAWSMFERSKAATELRFVTGNLIRAHGVRVPSDLVEVKERFQPDELIYFLRFVCAPSILDGTKLFSSSRSVMEERQAICAVLRELDAEKSLDYEEEITLISNQLAHHDVQHVVDSTRIYVDTEAFQRWALRELSEDIERCRDLAQVDFDDQVNFDDLFADLSQTSKTQEGVFKPETESELLLLQIFDRMREEFLNNPGFGLDFYLSKRVRHQSFIGFIRGPLEFSNLISNKETKQGRYSPNLEWVERLAVTDEESRKSLIASFSKFSEKFDNILLDAKNNKFQIRSQEKPEGLITLNFSAQTIRLAQVIFRMDLSVEEFISTAIAVCWAQLEVSLTAARSYVSSTLKADVSQCFDELRHAIKRKLGNTDRALEADMQIGQNSNEVQRKLDETKKWFSHKDIEQYKRSFKLEHIVNIAIDSSLKCHRTFEPKISQTVKDGEMEMTASALVFINDAISAGISNSEKHSGLRRPRIHVDVIPLLEERRLLIKVVTDSKPSNKSLNLGRIREIEQLIEEGNFHRRSRKEGGSGFIKLAAVVKQSDRGSIDFGFEGDSRFHLTVYYSLLIKESDRVSENESIA